ncbi:MAG: arylesterase [Acidobacteriota bacterium]
MLLLVLPLHAADRQVVVCFGDSITAGNGLSFRQAYPAVLQKDLDAAGYRATVINDGASGATTKDAVASLPLVLRRHPDAVIVEFGGNDGLRGLPLSETRANLDQVITTLQKAHAKVLLAGITLPPDYGPEYIREFEQMFHALAAQHRTAFVPMLYKDLIHVPGAIQPDGIHPTAVGSQIIAQTLMPALRPLLKKSAK